MTKEKMVAMDERTRKFARLLNPANNRSRAANRTSDPSRSPTEKRSILPPCSALWRRSMRRKTPIPDTHISARQRLYRGAGNEISFKNAEIVRTPASRNTTSRIPACGSMPEIKNDDEKTTRATFRSNNEGVAPWYNSKAAAWIAKMEKAHGCCLMKCQSLVFSGNCRRRQIMATRARVTRTCRNIIHP